MTKRPPSVIATIVTFSLLFLIGVIPTITSLINGSADFNWLFVPSFFLIGLVGVVMRKNWARIYSSIIILIFAFGGAITMYPKGSEPLTIDTVVLMLLVFGLLSWLFVSLAFGKASKAHFKNSESEA